ncbi:MAG TPA: PDZ domain-containing protein [Clostridiales bacterium]|nr:PDZ domain-containing protein [Clostridiales bacterium]
MNIIIALIVLSVIIMVHEFGHFMTGKMVGIYAEEFSIGMGPRLLKYEGKDTVYSLRALPIGGYVKFLGEDDNSNDPRAFNNVAVWKRCLVVVSGALMNFVFAIILLSILFSTHGIYIPSPTIAEIIEDSPAHIAGIQKDDIIVAIDNIDLSNIDVEDAVETIREVLNKNGSKPTTIEVIRNEEHKTFTVIPQYDEDTNLYLIGIKFGYELKKLGIGRSIVMAISNIGKMSVIMLKFLGNLIFKHEGIEDIVGPVGIVGEIGKAAQAGAEQLINLAIIISLNLGIINLVPFPALDGGRLLLLIIEGVRGKPIDREKEGLINLIGFVLLLLLMIVVTFKDIAG